MSVWHSVVQYRLSTSATHRPPAHDPSFAHGIPATWTQSFPTCTCPGWHAPREKFIEFRSWHAAAAAINATADMAVFLTAFIKRNLY
jgi:hypothetical protein